MLMIHGSATNHSTWSVQFADLKDDFCMLAYDRCGDAHHSIEDHADDAAEILKSEVTGPSIVVGSSFGGIVALDLARRYPSLVSTLVLCEPPLAQSDYLPAVPEGFGCKYDRLIAQGGGAAASEFFLRSVLGDEVFERMPKSYRARSMAGFANIRADMAAMARYRTRYNDLASEIQAKVLLLGGERSAGFYLETLEALQLAIPGATLHTMRGAGHMMQVEAHRQFAELMRSV